MTDLRLEKNDRIALVSPLLDAHTLGITVLQGVLEDCGFTVRTGDAVLRAALDHPDHPDKAETICTWLRKEGISVLGFSYRLDPAQGADTYARLVRVLKDGGLLLSRGGPVKALYFAGLPEACESAKRLVPETKGTFCGDESPAESLRLLGVPETKIPPDLLEASGYDDDRLAFGRELIQKGDYRGIRPPRRGGYDAFGTATDTLQARLEDSLRRGGLPLLRTHLGPFLPDRKAAVELFLTQVRQLAAGGFLDILSIGPSQLSQSDFNGDWTGKPDGGGVPLRTPEEFAAVWQAARPMLVRSYAGTRNVSAMARMLEETVHMAWHTLSLWWFSRLDGRGPNSVAENLRQHVETLKYVASVGKPYEPNVPHHFAFRGADDVTYVVSAVLAARLAKTLGIRTLVLQTMLNTPKYTWGIQDLAKSRALLHLTRELEDRHFRVILQPRGGLDYFSHEPEKAKAQLAAVTALMDDIEPEDPSSPQILHVVSYSEGSRLADPEIVEESIRITRYALAEYRRLRNKGWIDDMGRHQEVRRRTEGLISEAHLVLERIYRAVPQPLTAEGLYRVFALGFLPVPYLWECREEFPAAVAQPTRVLRGAVVKVDKREKAKPPY